MGVMRCFRNGCDNVMCTRYSPTYGYICYECFEELVASGPETNIKEFMNSEKEFSNYDRRVEAKERFKAVFEMV